MSDDKALCSDLALMLAGDYPKEQVPIVIERIQKWVERRAGASREKMLRFSSLDDTKECAYDTVAFWLRRILGDKP